MRLRGFRRNYEISKSDCIMQFENEEFKIYLLRKDNKYYIESEEIKKGKPFSQTLAKTSKEAILRLQRKLDIFMIPLNYEEWLIRILSQFNDDLIAIEFFFEQNQEMFVLYNNRLLHLGYWRSNDDYAILSPVEEVML